QVEYCLSHFEEARNSDKELCIRLFQTFYGITESMKMDDFFKVPSFESIVRSRRKIQEERRYPPTREEVAVARGWSREMFAEFFANKKELK
ncbi:MAG: hypothetical protein ABL876_17435, partial [Chitinophagaceae bacterium]